MASQLKVGELAKSSGLTVRTLHHYDEIGLLKPSGRSEAGYRLYSEADVARLHGIQALRHLGLPLADIAALFEGRGAAPQAIVEQQMRALDHEIARASTLRAQLAMIQEKFARGGGPGVGDWLVALQEMATYGKYFTPAELKRIFAGFEPLKADWAELSAAVQRAMQHGAALDSAEVQSLARRWMALMLAWMKGDFALMERWGEMYRREPFGHIARDAPPLEVIDFMRQATTLRMEAYTRHFHPAEMARFRHVPERDWQEVQAAAERLVEGGEPATGRAGRLVLKRWLALLDRAVSGDVALRDKLLRVNASEPLLAAGSPFSAPVQAWLRAGLHKTLDPHAT